MSTSKPRRINGLFVLVATVGLVFASAGPAAAGHKPVQGSGAGGHGHELGPNFEELCSTTNNVFTGAQFETTYYYITHSSSTYLVYNHQTPTSYYTGPVTMNIQHGDMVAGPQGSMPGECTGAAFAAAEVPLTSAVVVGNHINAGVQGYVNCTGTQGSYLRVNSEITIRFTTSCTIKGNTSTLTNTSTSVPIWHTVTGTQLACFEVPGGCDDPNTGSELTTTFSITGNG